MSPLAIILLIVLGVMTRGKKRVPVPGPAAAVGNSIVAHGGFIRVLNTLRGYRWQNFGVEGDTTAQMLARWRQWAKPQFTEILQMGCINDLGYGRPASWTIGNLRSIYHRARGVGARVVVVTSTPWSRYSGWSRARQAKQDEVLRWQFAGCDGLADVVVDAYKALADPENPRALNQALAARDQLHLNRAGQRLLGEVIIDRAYRGIART